MLDAAVGERYTTSTVTNRDSHVTKVKATHCGNCQVCGRLQHVMPDGMANHGYTVEFGYFSGICRGSHKPPVQQQRTITDATIVGLGEYAEAQDALVEEFKAGTTTPKRIEAGRKLNPKTYRYAPVYIEFSAGTPEQQAKAVELTVGECERDAQGARSAAAALKDMADRLHGTELVLIDDFMKAAREAAAKKAASPTVDVKAGKVYGAFGSKAARKEELDKINRAYGKEIDKLQAIYLSLSAYERGLGKRMEVYYAPMYPHQWKPKHSALALKEFPQAAEIVAKIEELVKVREAIKAAP